MVEIINLDVIQSQNMFSLQIVHTLIKGVLAWEINMGVCPRLDFDDIMLFNCLG